jgi:hypothetical protein
VGRRVLGSGRDAAIHFRLCAMFERHSTLIDRMGLSNSRTHFFQLNYAEPSPRSDRPLASLFPTGIQ